MRALQSLVLALMFPAVVLKNEKRDKTKLNSDIKENLIAPTVKNSRRRSILAEKHLQNVSESSYQSYLVKLGLGAIYQQGEDNALSSFKSIINKINNDRVLLPQNVTLEPVFRVINNTPYETLVSLCNLFVNSSVQALLFVCDEPCSRMTSLVGKLGWTGVKINKKSYREHYSDGELASTFVDIIPPNTLENHALVLLLNKFNWTEICLVSDDSRYAKPLVEDLYRRSRSFKIVSTVKYSSLDDSFIAALSNMKTRVRVFVLYCTHANGLHVLNHAKKLGLTNREFVWIVGETLVKSTVPASFPVGLLGIEYHSRDVTSAVHDAVETIARAVAAIIDDRGISDLTPPRGSCDDTDIDKTEGLTFFKEMTRVTFRGKTGVVSFNSNGQRTRARYNYLNLRSTGLSGDKKEWQEVGHLEDDHIIMHQIVWPGEVLHTPSGQTKERLKIVTYEVKPLVQISKYEDGMCYSGIKCQRVSGRPPNEIRESKCCYGVCIDILKQMSDDLDFIPDVYVMPLKAGSQEADGRWNGLIGEVMYSKADVAMASITITEKRSEFIDFSVPYYHTGLKFLVARTHGSLDGNGFLKPFNNSVWVLLFSLLYFAAFTLWFLETKNPGLKRLLRSNKKHTKFDIHVSIWVMFSRFFNSNLEVHHPNFYSSRALLFCWGFACLVIGALYTANLAAFMVLTEETRSIDGINDSKIQNPESSRLRFATIRNTSIERYFSRNFPHVYKFMAPYCVYNSSKAAVQAVKKKEIDAFIWEEIFLKNYEAHDSECNIFTVGKSFGMGGFGLVFRKGSKWTKKTNEVLLKYEQLGFMSKKVERWSKGSCSVFNNQHQLSTDPIAIESVLGVFYMLMAGIAYSMLVLFVEHLIFRFYLLPKKEKTEKEKELEIGEPEAGMDANLTREPDNLLLVKIEKELINLAMDLNNVRRDNLSQSVHDLSALLRRLRKSKEDRVTSLHGTEQINDFATALTFGEMKEFINESRCTGCKHHCQTHEQDTSDWLYTEKESVL